MKNRILSFLLAILTLASAFALFAVPAAAEDTFSIVINGDRYLQWDYVPGADRYCLCARDMEYGSTGMGKIDDCLYSDMPIDLKSNFENYAEGKLEIYLVAQKKDGKNYKTIASSNKLVYDNKSGIPHLPTPVARWDGTKVTFEPIDISLYTPFVNGSDLLKAVIFVFENGLRVGGQAVRLDLNINEFDAAKLITDPERKYHFTIEFATPDAGGVYWSKVGKGHVYTSEAVTGRELLNGYKTIDFIKGALSIGTYAAYGTELKADMSRVVAATALHCCWQYSTDGKTWDDTYYKDSLTFTPGEAHIGAYLRAKVTADGYGGYIVSNVLKVYRATQYRTPVKPEPVFIQDRRYIGISNAKRDQEYVVSTEVLTVQQLEGLWQNAIRPSSDGELTLPGKKGKINYIYTHLKQTATHYGGSQVAMASIFYGESVLEFDFDIKDYGFLGDDGEYYTLESSTPIEINVTSPTDGSTFKGVYGKDWKATFKTGEFYGNFYADYGCTVLLNDNTQYKRVFVKHHQVGNHVRISAAYNGQEHEILMNVGRDFIEPDSVTIEDVTVSVGSYPGGFRVLSDPQGIPAEYYLNVMNTLSFELESGEGNAPVVGTSYFVDGFEYWDGTLHIDARAATVGEYVYTILSMKNGYSFNMGTFTVTVEDVGKAVEDLKLSAKNAYLAPGESMKLNAILLPSGAEGEVVWSSSDGNVAYVSENGTVVVRSNAKTGDTATITAACNGRSDTCLITVGSVGFVDVPPTEYYADAVAWAVSSGITKGTDETHFSPDGTCTRAQTVTFLWRAMGEPEPTAANNPFTDMKQSAYYYKAVLWAVERGITKGTAKDKFSPDAKVTRAQSVTFLWRAMGEPNASNQSNPFKDVKSSEYYYSAVLWAVEKEITKGTSETKFSPDGVCKRAQIVTFLYRTLK